MRVAHTSLAEHPDLAMIEAVLTRLPHLTDEELQALAGAWRNTAPVARARGKALRPDSVLIIDVLRCFHDLAQLFAEDLSGEAAHLSLPPAVVGTALKAIRDALAAVILGPALSRREAARLLRPWRTAITTPTGLLPAPRRDVDQLVGAVGRLGERCHDPLRAEAFDRILLGAITRDRDAHTAAVDAAYHLAVTTRHWRSWSLLRERVETSVLHSSCGRCPSLGVDGYDRERVAMLCADAVGGLLMADVLPSHHLDVLLEPLSGLVPFPRPPLGA